MPNKTTLTKEEYEKRHNASHEDGEICMNCSPKRRGCCKKCWVINTAHLTSEDWCQDEFCECHKSKNMNDKTPSYTDKVIEQIMMKCNEVIAYAINGECGGRSSEDCKKELKELISQALEEQMKMVVSCLPANIDGDVKRFDGFLTCLQQTRQNLEEKGLI